MNVFKVIRELSDKTLGARGAPEVLVVDENQTTYDVAEIKFVTERNVVVLYLGPTVD